MVDAAPLTNNINFKKIYYAIYYLYCNSFNKHNSAAICRLTQLNYNL